MIQNERQYNVTRKQIATLNEALVIARSDMQEMDPRLAEAMVAGFRSQIYDLEQEIQEYERLRRAAALRLTSVSELATVLIQARIARGLTQKELAERLRLKPQQIQKYEATQYRSASLKRVLDVFRVLEVDLQGDVTVRREPLEAIAADHV
jgi:DNA-binding XRE family transcriptional regulator